MDDYLEKYGLTPAALGLDQYLQTGSHSGRPARFASQRDATRQTDHSCESQFSNTKLRDLPLAMAYVPMQPLESTYEQDEALKAGTLFPNLDKPFLGRRP